MDSPNDWIEEQEFDDICHNYRAWPVYDPPGVVARFEELKQFIRKKIEERDNGHP